MSGTPRSGTPLGAFRVFVRVRPSSSTSTSSCPAIAGNCRLVQSVKTSEASNSSSTAFRYNHVFWPGENDGKNEDVGSQSDVFQEVGLPLLTAVLTGYNACLFAYGQTGSGKTYSMMGCEPTYLGNGTGLIPRFCSQLLTSISQQNTQFEIDMSYFEIYNEKIYDLLVTDSEPNKKSLKIREHPTTGPYIENLTTHGIKDFDNVKFLLKLGNSRRATSATIHNDRSSRSHSIIQMIISKRTQDTLICSKVSLVDLAGSERIAHPSVNETHYREGLSINKSLLTLGKVINHLSDVNKGTFAPYRESVLTWLLKESLGGNSCTSMLATVSPDASSLEETLATLRYACQAKRIVNKVSLNEDPQHKTIRELRKEVERLKSLKESNIQDAGNLATLEMKQSLVEEKLQFELKRLSMDLVAAEKRRNELECQKNILMEKVKTGSISFYESDFFNNLKNILNDSIDDQYDNNLEEVTLHFQDMEKTVEALHNFCSSHTDKLQFNRRISPILSNIKKSCNDLRDIIFNGTMLK